MQDFLSEMNLQCWLDGTEIDTQDLSLSAQQRRAAIETVPHSQGVHLRNRLPGLSELDHLVINDLPKSQFLSQYPGHGPALLVEDRRGGCHQMSKHTNDVEDLPISGVVSIMEAHTESILFFLA